MGAVYTEDNWGAYRKGIFESALENTEVIVQSRSSNTWGPLSLDHVYEFMGGLNVAIRNVTGNDPAAYFSDLRNRNNPVIQGAKEAIWTETRTTLFNPKYINEMQKGGASSAETFDETFRNAYGWNVMKPDVIDRELWDGLYDIYVKDKYNLKVHQFFKEKNPYALQEMTAVMLETIRKGYWKPEETVKNDIAALHAELVKEFKAGCSGFVCDNSKLREMISSLLHPELKKAYNQQIETALTGEKGDSKDGMILEKDTLSLEKAKEIIADNLPALLSVSIIIILFSLAVIYGAVRRRE